MGKKAKSSKGAQRAQARKLDKSSLPPPPKAVNEEVRPDAMDLNSNVWCYYLKLRLSDRA